MNHLTISHSMPNHCFLVIASLFLFIYSISTCRPSGRAGAAGAARLGISIALARSQNPVQTVYVRSAGGDERSVMVQHRRD
ncbi:hypothetical protein BOTBODRAFT_39352 [Botryobasidium botryosum FD-172 SS1]|uniref:Secreted protein n=1 Tax=Botryobasidium botryosum (strain FD-172 SS1) TaxID=930990 RepID=A0A067LWZ5_BOTB1|nr:hypothetical protein BOTBODRAFT_39352 [Botryobasidium botryosum FD-172 SS1]